MVTIIIIKISHKTLKKLKQGGKADIDKIALLFTVSFMLVFLIIVSLGFFVNVLLGS